MKIFRPGTSSGPDRSNTRKRILYVEDEDENWEVAMLRLSKTYELVRARDAHEACEAIRLHKDSFFAILMDIQLHGSELDGIALTKMFRGTLESAQRPRYAADIPTLSTPIVFMTAYGSRYSEAELIAAGGSFLVTKPVDFLKLTLGLANLSLQQVRSTLTP
jgi:CheY-like chemotaxis protein